MVIGCQELVNDLSRLGVPAGGLMMVHSSLRSIGMVEGGADTVVDALLECLGPQGTLVVPTFTFAAPNQPGFVFDPALTPSEMGAISEAARRRAGGGSRPRGDRFRNDHRLGRPLAARRAVGLARRGNIQLGNPVSH